jgi:hypothetical protein
MPDTAQSSEQLALAARLVEVMRIGNDYRRIVQSRLGDSVSRSSALGKSIAGLANNFDHRAEIAAGYAKRLTANELRQLIAFFESPLGQRLLDVQSEILHERQATAGESIKKAADDIKRRLLGGPPRDVPDDPVN